ncbi:MAG: TIGR04423 family type III CRISPR-associated protein [Muribaculaceae bacterium]|nr:TIGR04423 family type III CRISPR-associated protein [Muribaculaceae bacterium]
MKTEEINNIPEGLYEGYYWLSDADKPVVINGSFDGLKLDPDDNPFVIEAQLFDRKNNKSFSVKYTDGRYYAYRYDLTATESNNKKEEVKVQKYCSNQMSDHPWLYFHQYWRAKSDELCEGMDVLQPAEIVFVGFKTTDKR